MKKIVQLFVVFISINTIAQNTNDIYILHSEIGLDISLAEKKQFNIFNYIPNDSLQKITIFNFSIDQKKLVINYLNGKEKTVSIPFSEIEKEAKKITIAIVNPRIKPRTVLSMGYIYSSYNLRKHKQSEFFSIFNKIRTPLSGLMLGLGRKYQKSELRFELEYNRVRFFEIEEVDKSEKNNSSYYYFQIYRLKNQEYSFNLNQVALNINYKKNIVQNKKINFFYNGAFSLKLWNSYEMYTKSIGETETQYLNFNYNTFSYDTTKIISKNNFYSDYRTGNSRVGASFGIRNSLGFQYNINENISPFIEGGIDLTKFTTDSYSLYYVSYYNIYPNYFKFSRRITSFNSDFFIRFGVSYYFKSLAKTP